MCGRFYVSEAELDDFAALIEGIEKDLLKPRPNRGGSGDIVPGDYAPVLVADPESRVRGTVAGLPALAVPSAVRVFSWGFPAPQGKGRIINARAETAMQKPMFRLPFATHRCLVPARGFYEWSDAPVPADAAVTPLESPFEQDMLQMTMDGYFPQAPVMMGERGPVSPGGVSLPDRSSGRHGKAPRIRHRFTRTDNRMLLMAGLYWTFRLSSVENHTAFTILTVDANADVSPIHDRMPLILEERDVPTWLSAGSSDAAAALLVSSAQGTLRREMLSAG